jgi:hypothetical protein
MNAIPGRGFGRGMGFGFRGGRGWGGFRSAIMPFGAPVVPVAPYAGPYSYGVPLATGPTRKQELDVLKGQAEYLEDALDGIKKRMAELEEDAEK